MFRILFLREWLLFWFTPTPYISLVGLLGASGYFMSRYLTSYVQRVEQYHAGFLSGGELPDLYRWVVEPYGETIAFFFLFVIPVCTARTFAEEKQNGQLQMMLTTAVRPVWIVLAKFTALFFSVSCMLICLLTPLLVLLTSADASLQPLVWAALSLLSLSAVYIALGCAVSQSVAHPIAAALLHLCLLLVLYFAHAVSFHIPVLDYSLAELLSPVLHAKRMLQGLFAVSDIGYFGALVAGMLTYTTMHLRAYQQGKHGESAL